MYALCVHQPFSEITAHAVAFQLSANHLLASSPLSGEEKFFIECMWEKLIWVMAREMLFQQKLTQKESLRKLMEFSQPLSLCEYKDQPDWIQEAYVEIQVKLQLIRSFGNIELHHSKEAGLLGELLRKRFHRDFVQAVGSNIDRSSPDAWKTRDYLRIISRKLWSKLFILLLNFLGEQGPGPISETHLSRLSSILSIFKVVDKSLKMDDCEGLRVEWRNTMDMAFCSLVLIGLLSKVSQYDEASSLSP
jgi:hypothetical protein